MSKKLTPLQYLKRELFSGEKASEFMRQWRGLEDADKADLKQWAEAEMAASRQAAA